ncbi:hypothetical protein O0I10_009594 [Lichtheimia ornata]|uniref:Secreted protein n=1 Tax=Lichtheimia ornata TaxID=688661 RepID=A0AAD7UXI9_9FUNG|nr:uncharacterized protein O0I10_009594 [Lichtheimia ornata]KAJ8654704.1 hypothetical protein O0I10_009594 [Lichtheimia ornata]
MRFTITTALGCLFAASLAHAQQGQAPAGTDPLEALGNYCKVLGPTAQDPVALTTAFCQNLAAGDAATGASQGGAAGSIPGVKELCELVKTEPAQAQQAVNAVEGTAPLPEAAKGILDKAQNICKKQGKPTSAGGKDTANTGAQ